MAALSKVELRPDVDRVTVLSALAGYGHRIAIARIGLHRDGTVGWNPHRQLATWSAQTTTPESRIDE